MPLFKPRRNRLLIMQHGVTGGSGYVPDIPRGTGASMLWESGSQMLWESDISMRWQLGDGIEYA